MTSFLRKFFRDDTGAGTVAAVIMLPFFLIFVVAAAQIFVLQSKQTMLDRGLEITARNLRLQTYGTLFPTQNQIKSNMCRNIGFIKNCMNQLTIEMVAVDRSTWTAPNWNRQALCHDYSDGKALDAEPVLQKGTDNQIMLMRACLKVPALVSDTIMSASAAGLLRWAMLAKDDDGELNLISTTVFANEPIQQ
ncbi:hypothetical protein [Thioclava sp. GXIMD4216]|uniref:Flp pilus assembly protein TadG n=1 Tax=Thioclava litoralis TaxID=3076557 RepID=A0ABZ1DZH7_9RHOB|nr:hypothetical protein RPE78_02520 [Thioclava sp. FTW29]